MNARSMLREFYRNALLSPDMLCLFCANNSWGADQMRCSESRKRDCHIFAGDMINQLAEGGARPAPEDSARLSAGPG